MKTLVLANLIVTNNIARLWKIDMIKNPTRGAKFEGEFYRSGRS